MIRSRRPAFDEESDLASRMGPRRRDSDWGDQSRTHEEDLAWAAKRAAVTVAAAMLHERDGGTGDHSDDVVHLCDAIADELGVYGHDRAELLAAAQLHDIGKVAIPPHVLEKPGPLDDREWALVRQHTVTGERIVRSVPELEEVARLVRHSHERWDGRGYPDGLAGEEIPLASRIVFCADAFHAIRSDRPYRRGRSARAALDEVRRNAGTQFDPEVADALEKRAGQMRESVRSGANGLPTTHRSRRLVSLLLTLALGGSALAAGSSQLLSGDVEGRADKPVPASSSALEADPARGEAPRSGPKSRTAANQVRRSDGRAAAKGPTPPRGPRAGWSGAATPNRPTLAAPSGAPAPPSTVPRQRRVGRPASPGRSGEAPRRPAQPGKPVGGAPGRSEEAPGRPSQPVKPVAPQMPRQDLPPAALPRGATPR